MSDVTTWSEQDSAAYRNLASVAVPRRDEQVAALLTLAPFATDAGASIVELGCGEGLLAQALLTAYPKARYLGLDGSDSMRATTSARLAAFAGRARVEVFDLMAEGGLQNLQGADLVVSSLCLHHLDDEGKRRVFAAIRRRLSPRGALLIADLVEPARAEALELFAETWNRAVAEQSRERVGDDRLLRRFLEDDWNHYRTPDDVDKPSRLLPSRLFEQLRWLDEAGFARIDCFWMRAGHAIYGGYVEPVAGSSEPGRFDRAMSIARTVLASSA
jgi:SAM-dependent methyltransferase